jgi:hypothetical protein
VQVRPYRPGRAPNAQRSRRRSRGCQCRARSQGLEHVYARLCASGGHRPDATYRRARGCAGGCFRRGACARPAVETCH